MTNPKIHDFDDIYDPFEPPEKNNYAQIFREYESSGSGAQIVPELLKLVEDLLLANEKLKDELTAEIKKPFIEAWDRESEWKMYISCLDKDISRLEQENRAVSLTRDAYLIDLAKCIKELNYWKEKTEKTNQNASEGDKNAQT